VGRHAWQSTVAANECPPYSRPTRGQVNEPAHSPQRTANRALQCYTEVTVDTTPALGCELQLVELLLTTLGHVCPGTKYDARSSANQVRRSKYSVRGTYALYDARALPRFTRHRSAGVLYSGTLRLSRLGRRHVGMDAPCR